MKPKWILLLACVCAGASLAQERAIPSSASVSSESIAVEPAQEAPAINFRVLKAWELDLGDHSIFYNRVVPPVFPEAPAPVVLPPHELTPAELEFVRRRERKEFKMMFLSATVYDREVTELRWWEGGKQYRVFSNIDFNYVAGMGEFESDSAVYMLLMGIGNETRKDVAEWNRYVAEQGWPRPMKTEVPSMRAFPVGRSTYFIAPEADFVAAWNRYVVEKGLPPEEMLAPQPPPLSAGVRQDQGASNADAGSEPYAALDALHVYYDANKQRLIEEYGKREAANAERARWLQEHPPIPKDTIINYWKKSGVSAPAGTEDNKR